MSSNPFSSDYAEAPLTQAAVALPAAETVDTSTAAAVQAVSLDITTGFQLTPIPMVNGKPRRVVIKGKVTRD
jgi:hypothetical protein